MLRSRSIKPEIFVNEKLAECEPLARLLLMGLWCMADREGRLEDCPKRIKAEILPYDECDTDWLLNQLAEHNFILRYEVDGKRYIQVVNFAEYQKPHHKEPPSMIPAPPKSQEKSQDERASSLNQAQPKLELSLNQAQAELEPSLNQAQPKLRPSLNQAQAELKASLNQAQAELESSLTQACALFSDSLNLTSSLTSDSLIPDPWVNSRIEELQPELAQSLTKLTQSLNNHLEEIEKLEEIKREMRELNTHLEEVRKEVRELKSHLEEVKREVRELNSHLEETKNTTPEVKNTTPEEMENATPEEREILSVLKSVERYPFDFAKDLQFIRDLASDYPHLDLLYQVKKWRDYKRDKPLTKKSSPRAQLRNWMKKANEWGETSNGESRKHTSAANETNSRKGKYAHLYLPG